MSSPVCAPCQQSNCVNCMITMTDPNFGDKVPCMCQHPILAAHADQLDREHIERWAEQNGEEVQVGFTVPVEVVVNLVTREVVQVVLIDEGVALDLSADGKPEVNTRENFKLVTDEQVRELAGGIADAPDSEWPAWEHGW